MQNDEAINYLRGYFDELFINHNVDALNRYLHPDYFDDDIGDPAVDHIQNSKDYLRARIKEQPCMRVEVVDAIIHDDVITAYLIWHITENGRQKVLHKGVAIFVLKDGRMLKRHTFLYFDA